MTKKTLASLIQIAMVLAWLVLMLGAYTRLTDAGLGCPDWPGCYGHIVMPAAEVVKQAFPHESIETVKAWTEMAHRYLAGLLVATVTAILLLLQIKFRGLIGAKLRIALLGLLVFQALLGMWTVTLKLLPIVVMGHLMGGFTIFACLAAMRSVLLDKIEVKAHNIRRCVFIGLILVLLQIALGGWVSANYASISCIGFPMCNGQWLPELNFAKAFNLLPHIGPNYQGGLLDIGARMTIQMTHRFGALVVFCYWTLLSMTIMLKVANQRIRMFCLLLLGLLAAQIVLGIVNVIYLLPVVAAVMHNGVAALLLGCIVIIFNLIQHKRAIDV